MCKNVGIVNICGCLWTFSIVFMSVVVLYCCIFFMSIVLFMIIAVLLGTTDEI